MALDTLLLNPDLLIKSLSIKDSSTNQYTKTSKDHAIGVIIIHLAKAQNIHQWYFQY